MYLGASAFRLVGADNLLALLEVVLLAQVQVHGKLLVILRHLGAQVTAARMDNQVLASLPVLVNLYKMVAAAQGPQGALQALGVL